MTKKSHKAEDNTSLRLRDRDPHLETEREKYETPLPSREFILEVLREQGMPVVPDALIELLDITEEERDLFLRRIRAMERDGQLMRNRKHALCVVDKIDLIPGKVEGHADGFGFLVPDDGTPDLFLGPKEMHKVLHGDRVVGRELRSEQRSGRREATIVEVLQRANQKVVGRLYNDHGIWFLVAENKRINQDFLVPAEHVGEAKPGQVVVAEILQQPDKHAQPLARVDHILGSYGDPGMEIEIALRKHDLPHEFSPTIEALSKKFPKGVLKKDFKGREDIRSLPLVTIDGETARDFDDAVYCAPEGRGWRLLVAIADVSHYVKPGDPLDVEAFDRGNSVYFPRRVIPMLPEVLSNGLCSLNPQVERLCMVCDMSVTSAGNIKQYRFYPAVMFSHARLTYTQVADWLANPESAEAQQHAELLPHLQQLYKMFKVLLKAREKRGAIDFETTETRMVFNAQGKIDCIVPVVRNDAHRLIEECMLAANVCASDFLKKHKQTTLYRIHEGPTPEKLKNVREFLGEFGMQLGGGDEPNAKDYAGLLGSIKGRPDAQLLQTVLLRSLQQAVYSPDNVGHFGLAYETYTHFTSPIRRYPDLLIHRGIKAVLQGEHYSPGDWHQLGAHCSSTERRADDATRDVEAWLKYYFMQDKVGEVFEGTISAVTSFGIFVALDNIYVEGLVHVSELGSDYFHFEPTKHQMLGERTGKRFRLGDRMRIKVARVDMDTTRMDFMRVPDEDEQPAAPAAPKSRGRQQVAKAQPQRPEEQKAGKPKRKRSRSRAKKKAAAVARGE